jgi:hypothetical protein
VRRLTVDRREPPATVGQHPRLDSGRVLPDLPQVVHALVLIRILLDPLPVRRGMRRRHGREGDELVRVLRREVPPQDPAPVVADQVDRAQPPLPHQRAQVAHEVLDRVVLDLPRPRSRRVPPLVIRDDIDAGVRQCTGGVLPARGELRPAVHQDRRGPVPVTARGRLGSRCRRRLRPRGPGRLPARHPEAVEDEVAHLRREGLAAQSGRDRGIVEGAANCSGAHAIACDVICVSHAHTLCLVPPPRPH